MCDVSARYASCVARSRENFWRDASSACRPVSLATAVRALSVGGAGQAVACLAYGCPILNTRDGGGELKTLEPCHRSRPGTAPSHRRRSPFASDAAAGPMGSAARLRASSRGARTLAFSASGIACGPQTLPGGPESIRENSPSTSLRLVRDNSSQDKSVSRAARGRLALARTTRSCSDPAAGAHGKRAHKQRPHSLCTHCTSPSAVRRASDADAKEASEPCSPPGSLPPSRARI